MWANRLPSLWGGNTIYKLGWSSLLRSCKCHNCIQNTLNSLLWAPAWVWLLLSALNGRRFKSYMFMQVHESHWFSLLWLSLLLLLVLSWDAWCMLLHISCLRVWPKRFWMNSSYWIHRGRALIMCSWTFLPIMWANCFQAWNVIFLMRLMIPS